MPPDGIRTTSDLLWEIHGDLKAVKSSVDVLVSQDLDCRVDVLESLADQAKGAGRLAKAIFGSSILAALAAILSLYRTL